MSGIVTPIIDTLLHEVLGKRVDAQSHREFLEPIKPLSPGNAPRAVHSDSRLNAEQAAAQRQGGIGDAIQRQGFRDGGPLAPPSTQTHFSPAARSIADILAKFPAPPSVLKSPLPLIATDTTGDVPQVASRLRQSIETSGLFYESHQARWLRGEMSRVSLFMEPQAQLFPQRLPTPGPEVARQELLGNAPWALNKGDASVDRSSLLGRAQGLGNAIFIPAAPATQPASTIVGAPMPGASQLTDQAGMVSQVASADRQTVEFLRSLSANELESPEETLQGLVRHQLEMLVTPTLRWEGDIWSGVFMALAIHMPERQDERPGEERGPGKGGDDDAVWYSEVSLQLPRLGQLTIHLHMRSDSLSLTLESESANYLGELRGGAGSLEKRLMNSGAFEEVRVSILAKRNEPEAGAY